MTKGKTYKSGTPAPASAQYGVVGSRGGKTGKEVTVPKGHNLPPTSKPGMGFVINDRTKNNSGKGN